MSDDVVRVDDSDDEAWERVVDDPDLRGVDAHRFDADPWTWQVGVWVAEFLREEPLEGELRRGVDAALRSVAGVTDVAEEDREVWIVQGEPSGRELVRAVGQVVDALAERAAAHMDELLDD